MATTLKLQQNPMNSRWYFTYGDFVVTLFNPAEKAEFPATFETRGVAVRAAQSAGLQVKRDGTGFSVMALHNPATDRGKPFPRRAPMSPPSGIRSAADTLQRSRNVA